MKALLKGYKVLFTPVAQMLRDLNFSRPDNSYYQKLDYYRKPDLLILDELDFKKLPGYSADDSFEIITRRYEAGSLIITTNKCFDKWRDIFTDTTMTSAILDSVVHHSVLIQINDPSYRVNDLKAKGGGS
jgi:DNA replication protein DnaC